MPVGVDLDRNAPFQHSSAQRFAVSARTFVSCKSGAGNDAGRVVYIRVQSERFRPLAKPGESSSVRLPHYAYSRHALPQPVFLRSPALLFLAGYPFCLQYTLDAGTAYVYTFFLLKQVPEMCEVADRIPFVE